jgi:hypothetical protein
MKKTIIFLSALVSILMAQDSSSIRVGGCYAYTWMTPQGSSTFVGNLGGAQGIYEYHPANSLYEAVSFSWKQGVTHQSPQTRFLLNFDAHERIGYTWASLESEWSATFFTGLGYHYLGQKLEQPVLASLFFNYNELYVPVGFLLRRNFSSGFFVGFNGTWMPQVYPAVTILPLGGSNWIVKRTFANSLVEVPLGYCSPCNRFTVEFKPFFEFWQDGATVAVSQSGFALNIPENTYLFAGAELNLGYSF